MTIKLNDDDEIVYEIECFECSGLGTVEYIPECHRYIHCGSEDPPEAYAVDVECETCAGEGTMPYTESQIDEHINENGYECEFGDAKLEILNR